MTAVRLISYTKIHEPSFEDDVEHVNDLQKLVAYCARISNPDNQLNSETNEKLIEYLLNHSHFSPFEMVNVCLCIDTTRDIGRQILRHRSFTFQEYSQRYSDPTKDLEFIKRDARLQDPKNRQNSIDLGTPELEQNPEHFELYMEWNKRQQGVIEQSRKAYKWAIDHGIAKEQARSVLPEGQTMTKILMNGTLRSWIHYCELRTDHGTQKEHKIVAGLCAEAILPIFPSINRSN